MPSPVAKRIVTNRFSRGEISRSLAAKTNDLSRQDALLRARNVYLPTQGGAKRRPVAVPAIRGLATGVERIFEFNKSEDEVLVVGLFRTSTTDTDSKYRVGAFSTIGQRQEDGSIGRNADGTSDTDFISRTGDKGLLVVHDINKLNAFHYGNSIAFTQATFNMQLFRLSVDAVDTNAPSARSITRDPFADRETSTIQGFEVVPVEHINPPVTPITALRDNAGNVLTVATAQRIYGTDYVNVATGANDEAVLVYQTQPDGTQKLISRAPQKGEVGLPVDTANGTAFVMDWNDLNGWMEVTGHRQGRLIVSGSYDQSPTFYGTVVSATGAIEWTAERKANEDVDNGSTVAPDFGFKRTLDSFERIVAMFADNGFVIFTEGGEWSIQGVMNAAEFGSLRARKYSHYGCQPYLGVTAIDSQIFFFNQESAYSLLFQGDDVGYDAEDFTSLFNETILQNGVRRLFSCQPRGMGGTKVVCMLTPVTGNFGSNDLVVWHTEKSIGRFGFTVWRFPHYQVVDAVSVRDEIYILADTSFADPNNFDTIVTERRVFRLDPFEAEVSGNAGDWVPTAPDTDSGTLAEGGAQPFPIELQLVNVIAAEGSDDGWTAPFTLDSIYFDALMAQDVQVALTNELNQTKTHNLQNNAPGDNPEALPTRYGRRRIKPHSSALNQDKDIRDGFFLSISQNNLEPAHYLRVDYLINVNQRT